MMIWDEQHLAPIWQHYYAIALFPPYWSIGIRDIEGFPNGSSLCREVPIMTLELGKFSRNQMYSFQYQQAT